MARTLFSIAEGWTQELGPFVLRIDGAPADLTGIDVTAVVHDRSRGAVTLVVRVDDDQSSGRVYLTPTTDLVNTNQPYAIRFRGVDGAGKAVFFPDDAAYEFRVFKP